MKKQEIIRCPNSYCGKLQSREEYENFACWNCGSILPIPPLQQVKSPEPVIEGEQLDEKHVVRMADLPPEQ